MIAGRPGRRHRRRPRDAGEHPRHRAGRQPAVRHGRSAATWRCANNIKALANTAGANIIVDDIGYPDEPMFQDGLISQAIDTVTAQGVTYFSAAGNAGRTAATCRHSAPPAARSPGIGTGTFMNFNPNGGDEPRAADHDRRSPMPRSRFEYDQPYADPGAGGLDRGVVTSNVNIYVINAATAPSSSAPRQPTTTSRPRSPAVRHDSRRRQLLRRDPGRSGAQPGPRRVRRTSTTPTSTMIVSQQYGSAGGTYYPDLVRARRRRPNTIGVGATPWWAPASLDLGQNPLANEPFSSDGPAHLRLQRRRHAADRARRLVQNPTVTAPDGGNTSFFVARPDSSIPPTLRSRASRRPSTNLVPTAETCRPSSAPRRPRPTPRPWRP